MSKTKLLIIGGGAGLVVLGLMIYLVLGSIGGGNENQQMTLQFWGTFDEGKFYSEAINEFNKIYPSVHIIYRQFNFEDYEKQLIDSFAAGTGPDIWLMHNTWLPKHADKIQPLPQQTLSGEKGPIFTFKQFQEQFVDVTASDLTNNGQIYGLPTYVDTLALYYNKDLFNTAGIAAPPATWDDFSNDVRRLTVLDSRGNIAKAGAAIGTASNINRSVDILTLLMLQNGTRMTDSDNNSATFASPVGNVNTGENALEYYTDFANPSKQSYTWNDNEHYSVDAFTNGEAAMMFNYSHNIATIRDRSARFNFGIAPVPQISGAQVKVNYSNYWAPTVSKQSKNPNTAWKFLVFLSSGQGDALYVNAAVRPSARRDLIDKQKSDPDMGIFATQALSARSWYQVENSAIETIFAQMIDDVNFSRSSIRDALSTAESKVNVLMTRTRNNNLNF